MVEIEKLTKRQRADLCKYIRVASQQHERKQDLQTLIEKIQFAEAQAAREAMNEVDREVAVKLLREEQND